MAQPPRSRSISGDYRIFIGAFPGGELAEQLQALRLQYDPLTARITPPHVTLAGTYWRSGAATPENEARDLGKLSALAGKLPPLTLHLGGVGSFPPAHKPVVCLGVQVTPELLQVRQALLAVMGQDKHRHFSPHLTLAMRLTGERAGALLQALRGGLWDQSRWLAPIDELRFMQRGPGDPSWRTIGRLALPAVRKDGE